MCRNKGKCLGSIDFRECERKNNDIKEKVVLYGTGKELERVRTLRTLRKIREFVCIMFSSSQREMMGIDENNTENDKRQNGKVE